VYVLHSMSDDGLYIGYSSDLKKRLKQHRAGLSFATSYRGLRGRNRCSRAGALFKKVAGSTAIAYATEVLF
jgi:GIY-YIG catalytic domain